MDNFKYNLMLLENTLRRMEKDGRLREKDHLLILEMIEKIIKLKLRNGYDVGFDDGYAEAKQLYQI